MKRNKLLLPAGLMIALVLALAGCAQVDASLQDIRVSNNAYTMDINSEYQVTFTTTPTDYDTSKATITYELISGATAADLTVNSSTGLVKSGSVLGNATIKVTVGNKSASVVITVRDFAADAAEINGFLNGEHQTTLRLDIETVEITDKAAVYAALNDWNELSDNAKADAGVIAAKANLDALNAKIAVLEEVADFLGQFEYLLDFTTDDNLSGYEGTINNALDAWKNLSSAAQNTDEVTALKEHLDALAEAFEAAGE